MVNNEDQHETSGHTSLNEDLAGHTPNLMSQPARVLVTPRKLSPNSV